jgi:hypothetical protein
MLQPDDEALAAELVDRYGDAIDVTVGVLSYPIAEASPVCTEPVGERSPAGLEVAIVPPAGPFVTSDAEPWSFEIRLTNVGDAPIAFGSGIATGTVLDAIGNVVGSSANIGREDVGIQIDLAPGASTSLPGVVGPASCEPRLGYLLPPDDYQLVATLSRFDASSQGTLLTPPQPIVVTT